MDPNKNLADLLEIAHRLVDDEDHEDYLALEASGALRLAELAIALDEWIRKGGFMPEAWSDAAPEACDCADRSWYGEEHDSACPCEGPRTEGL
jgi:hypothetical protein